MDDVALTFSQCLSSSHLICPSMIIQHVSGANLEMIASIMSVSRTGLGFRCELKRRPRLAPFTKDCSCFSPKMTGRELVGPLSRWQLHGKYSYR